MNSIEEFNDWLGTDFKDGDLLHGLLIEMAKKIWSLEKDITELERREGRRAHPHWLDMPR